MLDARGVMEPWQEPRQGRGWLILLLGITVFAAFGAVVGYAYFKGLPGIGGEPPLIKAQEGPYRHAPADRGGLSVPNTNSSIVTVLRPQAEPPRVERILPPEAAPALQATEPDAELDEPTVPEQPLAALATPDEEAALARTTARRAWGCPIRCPSPCRRTRLSVSTPSGTAITALPQVEPSAPPLLQPEPAPEPEIAAPAPLPAPEPPVAVPAAPEPVVATPEPAVAAPVAAAPEPQRLVRAEPAAPAPQRATTGAGIYRLQLAAVRSEGGLTQAWADLRQRYPTALGAVNPQVERTDTTSGPLFRLQAGPFVSREAAANACGSIRGSGGQCFIVGPIGQ